MNFMKKIKLLNENSRTINCQEIFQQKLHLPFITIFTIYLGLITKQTMRVIIVDFYVFLLFFCNANKILLVKTRLYRNENW